MSDLDDIVVLTITRDSSAISQAGFGTPMILPATVPAGFTERLRYYTSAAAMLDDDFLTTDAAYILARTMMSQSPHPERFAIGRRATPVAQTQLFVIPAAPNNSTLYRIVINGENCDYTTDGSATQTELRDGILAAINTAVGSAVTATTSTNDVLVTADTAGIPFTFSIDTAPANDITAGAATANVGIPEDLAAIHDYQPDWYCLLITQRDRDHIMTAAAEIEAMKRIFICQSNDAAILSDPYDSGDPTTDVASELHALAYDRTALVYHPDDAEALDAAAVGQCLPHIPGSITWKFKSFAGVDATQLTETELTNLRSKSANGYRTVAGVGIFYEGTMSSGEFIDIIHGTDKLEAKIQENFFDFLRRAPKVPMTQKGLDSGEAPIKAAFKESVQDGLIADSRELPNGDVQMPAFTVTAPRLSSFSSSDRASRTIPASAPYTFEGTYAGAVHKVRVTGTLSV